MFEATFCNNLAMPCKPESIYNALAVEHIPTPINHTVTRNEILINL